MGWGLWESQRREPGQLGCGGGETAVINRVNTVSLLLIGLIPLYTRTRWAEGYESLREENLANLEVVEGSLLALCLDEDTQNLTDTDKSKKDMLR